MNSPSGVLTKIGPERTKRLKGRGLILVRTEENRTFSGLIPRSFERSFHKTDLVPLGFAWFPENIRIPGKNGEASPRHLGALAFLAPLPWAKSSAAWTWHGLPVEPWVRATAKFRTSSWPQASTVWPCHCLFEGGPFWLVFLSWETTRKAHDSSILVFRLRLLSFCWGGEGRVTMAFDNHENHATKHTWPSQTLLTDMSIDPLTWQDPPMAGK